MEEGSRRDCDLNEGIDSRYERNVMDWRATKGEYKQDIEIVHKKLKIIPHF